MHDGVMIDDLEFVRTCFACPEQYDVYAMDGDKVGFVHLRNGSFTVYDGEQARLLYSARPHESDGIFTGGERDIYLGLAASAIAANESPFAL